jgi:hypothetical protein
MAKRNTLDPLRDALSKFKAARDKVKEIGAEVSSQQPELITLMKETDPDNLGVVVDPDDSKGTAYVQQNKGSLYWDDEEIVDWLRKPANRALWMKSSSRVFDPAKWEALVGSKEIPPKTARRFKKQQPDPKPFIRFDPKKEDSL